MLGAIIGDFVGSVHEYEAPKHKDFTVDDPACFVTDDSILTLAVADWIMRGHDLVDVFHDMVRRYPESGWGQSFYYWARDRRREPYNSYGNGAGMRVSAVGWAHDTIDDVMRVAAQSAAPTHNHPEGIKGAQATAVAVFLARTTKDKETIRREVTDRFAYDLKRTVDGIRPTYSYDITCQGTVPEAIIAFLDSTDFEDAIRNAISLGGDADTLACIAGGIAHAYYGALPKVLAERALLAVPVDLRPIWNEFREKYRVPA